MYDPRVGRFFAVDPLTKKYPFYSPYSFSGNRVIDAVELEGLEPDVFIAQARAGLYGETTQKIVVGTEDGVTLSLQKTWHFITRDAWTKKPWQEALSLVGEAGELYAGVESNAPKMKAMADAMAKTFDKEVINGNAYTRSKALSQFSTDVVTAYLGSKGLGTITEFTNAVVKTPWVIAKQSKSIAALGGAARAKAGAKLYRIGTTGVSAQGAEAQFWALENPLVNPEAYAKKYNVPLENIKNADFFETANLKSDAEFITREAGSAQGSANTGKGIEVVVEKGGTRNNVITPIKR